MTADQWRAGPPALLGSNFALATPWYRCDSEELKMEIPEMVPSQRACLGRVGRHFALLVLLAMATPVVIARAQSTPGSFKLSDPVPDLLNGPQVTTDIATLTAGGRTVQGAAADGVSEIVIALGADSAGEQITFQVVNDLSQPSTSPAQDGALAGIGTAKFDSRIT